MNHWMVLIFSVGLVNCASLQHAAQSTPLAGCLSGKCAATDRNEIVNGQRVDENSAYSRSAVLLITETEKGPSLCTAAPIGRDTLLTAAHCVYKMSPAKVKAVFSHDFTPSSKKTSPVITAEKLKIHNSYDGSANSFTDLAIIKLKTPIPDTYKIIPLFDGKNSSMSDKVVLLGYGITDEKAKDSLLLRMTTKSFKNDTYVKESLLGFNQTNETGGFCKGDSGAPVIAKVGTQQKLIGINSFTASKNNELDCRSASFAMYVPYFRSWVIKELVQL